MKGSQKIGIAVFIAAIYYLIRFTVWLWYNEPADNDHGLFVILITLLSIGFIGWTLHIFLELTFDDEPHWSYWINPIYPIYRFIKWLLFLSDKYLSD